MEQASQNEVQRQVAEPLRKSILQILYDERLEHPYMLNREELAARLGREPSAIQADIACLEEKGYLITKPIQVKLRTFYMPHITPLGIEFVENDGVVNNNHFRKVDVFISSPGDMSEEREIVKDVLERCNRIHSIAEHYVLRPLAYEESVPAEVGDRPQTIVDRHMQKARYADLFICFFGCRMGTPVIHEETGEHFQSGTDYEFQDAYRHNQEHKKPCILLYRSRKPCPPDADPEQVQAVDDFFKQFEGADAKFKGIYKTFQSSKEFSDKLFYDIDAVLAKKLI